MANSVGSVGGVEGVGRVEGVGSVEGVGGAGVHSPEVGHSGHTGQATTGSVRDLDDRELMRRHVAGDPDAFGELFRRHRDRMWAVAVRTTGNREVAADCVQDAFISAFRRASSYRGDAAVTTWLHRIVVNACLDRLRRDRPTSELQEFELADRHDDVGSAETRLDVRQALARLPEGQRLALVLVDMHGLSVAEAAAVLDVAEGTVKSRCSRGREALAALLAPRGENLDGDRATVHREPSEQA